VNTCLDSLLRVRELADKLAKAWCYAYSWILEYCRLEESVIELCTRLRNAMDSFMKSRDDYVLGVVPCQIIDGGEIVGAVYLSSESGKPPYLLLASYTILDDTIYAAFTILHEISHHVGFNSEDLADFIATTVIDKGTRKSLLEFLEKPPKTVEQAIKDSIRSGRVCDIRGLEKLLEDKGLIRVYVSKCNST